MNRKSLVLLCVFLVSVCSYGQNDVAQSQIRADLIKDQLSKKDLGKIVSLEKDEKEAYYVMESSDKNYQHLEDIGQQVEQERDKKKHENLLKKSRKCEKKAIVKRVESLKCFHEVFVQRYKIYKADLKKYFVNADENKKDSAKVLEDLAYHAFESADLDIDKVYYTLNQNDLFKAFTRAYQSEQLGLLYQEKMYAIFLNWANAIKARLDQEIEAFIQNKPVEEEKQQDEVVKIKDSINIKTILVYDTIHVKEEKTDETIIYKVQIAASDKQVNPEQLRRIYPQQKLINSELHNGMYKYTVGSFSFYKDAQTFKINTGVPDAFIVVYKNGRRVPITEVIKHKSYLQR